MKDYYVADLNVDEEITDYFLVKDIALRVGSNSKQYLDLLIADKTGEIRGKKWDVSGAEAEAVGKIRTGDIIKIKALVTEWNGTRQLRIMRLRILNDMDVLERTDYYRAAPEDTEEMFAFLRAKALLFRDEDLKKLALKVLDDNRQRLLYFPAAAKNHHAEYGGLLWHMKRMLMLAERCCEVYENLNADLLMCGVIIHDMEKLNEMDSDENGVVSSYTFEGTMLGHLVMGVVSLGKICDELGIAKEKKTMLQHMSLSHHYEADYGSPKKPLFPEAEALHYMDMLDSKMYDMEEALRSTETGGFSERVFTLDGRKVYKRTW
jgi:3'-5' exoribonuclease